MSAKPCSRVWQAEAVLDGILSRADAASFERHVATCVECSAERAALARLTSVAQRLPSPAITPLRRRALHHELLRRANELSVGARPSLVARLRLGVSVPLAACLVALLLLVLARFSAWPGRAELGSAPVFELAAEPNSRWHVESPGSRLRLALEGGTFVISVQKLSETQRFALSLPDGELEVRGTRFTVECDAQRTRRVAVAEGRVALRLSGQAELSLGPGQVWPSETVAPAAPSARVEASPPRAPASGLDGDPGLPPRTSEAELALGSGRRATKRSAAPRPHPASASASSSAAPAVAAAGAAATRAIEGSSLPSAAAREFAQAMAVFSQGDFGTAERLFRGFEQRYPRSPHAEDVLFLMALGRSRRGDASGARVLAREYLARYPGGFRAEEARAMAREPASRAGIDPNPALGASPGLVTFP